MHVIGLNFICQAFVYDTKPKQLLTMWSGFAKHFRKLLERQILCINKFYILSHGNSIQIYTVMTSKLNDNERNWQAIEIQTQNYLDKIYATSLNSSIIDSMVNVLIALTSYL